MNINNAFVYRNLNNNIHKTYDELLNNQFRKIKALICYAYDNVDYYRKLFVDNGIHPNDIKSYKDFISIPVLTKDNLRMSDSLELLSIKYKKNYKNLILKKTSGSTGKPLQLYFSKEEINIMLLGWGRSYQVNGLSLFDKQAIFRHKDNIPGCKKWFQYLGILRRTYIPTEISVEEQYKLILNCDPNVVLGYSGSIEQLAKYLLYQNKHFDLKILFGTSEMLSGEAREVISKAFYSDIIDLYGSMETGCVAWECPHHNGLHINIDLVHLEVLKDNSDAGKDELGRLIITPLFMQAMPLLRYEIGDIGSISSQRCSCGCQFPLMNMLEGRSDNFIVLPNGINISPRSFGAPIRQISDIKDYLIIQEDSNSLDLYIVTNSSFQQNMVGSLRNDILDIIYNKLEVNIRIVDCLPKIKGNKIQSVISYVKPKF